MVYRIALQHGNIDVLRTYGRCDRTDGYRGVDQFEIGKHRDDRGEKGEYVRRILFTETMVAEVKERIRT